ncbi:MAG: penicillin-binding protein 2 [Deltaproteobacteria bacterium]|nr:MAG: penicillin-binding protein 2 [Deltaproteobacteria bacterium]
MLIRSAPGAAPVMPQLRRRLRWLVAVALGTFAILVGRLWQLQVLRGERYHEGVIEKVVNTRYLPSVRGKILDTLGRPLVDNRPAFNIYMTPASAVGPVVDRLAGLLDLDDDERRQVVDRLAAARRRDPNRAVLVLEDQSRDRAALVEQSKFELPGVSVVDEPYRRYLYGDLAAHALGYMNHPTAEELAELGPRGYDADEFIGRYGLEREWEHYLRGKKGIERYVADATGARVDDEESAALIRGPKFEPPVPGNNIVTTIDLDLQQIAERAVRWHAAAAVVVLDVHTGRVRAIVSKPSFDPNVMTGHLTQAQMQQMLADPRKPFVDKVLRQHYPPGSTFKPVTLIAALEDGVIAPGEVRECKGRIVRGHRTFRCPGGHAHGKITVVEALEHSCNVFVWELAEVVGIDRLAEVARDLGFGQPTGIGLNGDVAGRIPTRAWYEARGGFKIGYTLNTATGQGDVAVTVMQLAQAYAAIANGGALYAPQIVERIEDAEGRVVARYEPTLRRRIHASPQTIEQLHRGMWAVVNAEGGTAHDAASAIIEFAGKTGTAQVRGRRRRRKDGDAQPRKGWDPTRDHAWFAGWAPARDPAIAIAVLVEHGGHGGEAAAPIAREIFEGYAALVRERGGRP